MIIITKIDNHKEINKNLLSLIDKIPKNKLLEKVDIIDNTDWNLSTDIKKEYVEYFISIINPYLKKMASQLMSNSYDITNIWFQQYSKLGTHGWHNHPRSNWTNVYFVELLLRLSATMSIRDPSPANEQVGQIINF